MSKIHLLFGHCVQYEPWLGLSVVKPASFNRGLLGCKSDGLGLGFYKVKCIHVSVCVCVRSPFQKDTSSLTSKFPSLRTRSFDHPTSVDPRRGWVVQPTKKFDDSDEEAQSPMVTSHNGTTPVLHGIPPLMTSSLCSTNGDEPFARSSGTYL